MSVVSSQIGFIDAPVRRFHPNVAVQYAKNDSGEAEPADFMIPASVPFFGQCNPPSGCTTGTPTTGEEVPVKFRQYGSGMALFNTPTPAATASLDIPDDMPAPASIFKGQYASVPEPAPFNYNMGIRPGPRPIDFSTLDQPASAVLYRRQSASRGIPSGRVTDGISYDVGIDELRAMATRSN
jgi:hypothetical protein